MNELCVSCHYARMRDDVCGIYCTGGFVESNGKCKHYKNCEEAWEETGLTREEIVTALRCVAACGGCDCPECESTHIGSGTCVLDQNEYFSAAADLIENQQREIEALRQANEGLRFNLAAQEGGEICRAALEAFGAGPQVMMAIEEMSELTKELCKNGRGQENTTHIAEEIADVEIMLCQMVMLFDCGGQVDKFRRYKLERLAGRIKEVKG